MSLATRPTSGATGFFELPSVEIQAAQPTFAVTKRKAPLSPPPRTGPRTWGRADPALAHANRDRVEAAYMRSGLFERWRELMQAWADYVSESELKG